MPRHQEVILTNMCLVEDQDGRVLMQIRDPKRYAWHGAVFPGGHIEEGESLHAAVVREVLEETGLTIKDPVLLGVKHFFTRDELTRYLVFLYKATDFSGEIRSSEEGEVLWIAKEELDQIDLADSMADMFPLFFGNGETELFYTRQPDGSLKRDYF